MMKKLLIFLLFVANFVGAQTSELTGTFAVRSATGTDPTFTVQGYFNSTVGFDAADVIVGDLLIVRYVSGTTHRRNIYNITSVSSSGSNLTVGVTRLTGTSTSFFPTGTHAISRKTANGLIYDVANVSQELEGYVINYDLGLLEGFKVDTVTVDADTLILALEDGTTFNVTLPSGSGGGGDLGVSSTPTAVTITNTGGTNATISSASPGGTAGILTGADKLKIDNSQTNIQWQDEYVNQGSSGGLTTINFKGAGVTATDSSGYLNVDIVAGSVTTVGETADSTVSITEPTSGDFKFEVDVNKLRPLIDTCYEVTISGGNANSELRVCASGPDVTAVFSSNKLTISGTTTSRVKSAYWRLVSADIQSSADVGGVANWVQVEFSSTRYNTAVFDMRVPIIQKIAIPSTGLPSVTNPASVDIDNNPITSVVGLGSNSITLRVGGIVPGSQGYQLSFTGVH